MNRLTVAAAALLLVAILQSSAPAQPTPQPKTFCNPLDLDYGPRQRGSGAVHRHGADPVVVTFNDRYYLFSTWDIAGYRVSDDLVTWKSILFAEPSDLVGQTYTAPAVIVLDGWIYFTEFGKESRPVGVYRTRDPDTGRWERVSPENLPAYADPMLFLDPPSGRLFMYYGLEKPIHGLEMDRATLRPIDGTLKQLMPAFDPGKRIENGWEVCTWDHSEASKPMRGNKTFFPCREGAWMTYHDGKYYLQYASPGTTVPGYADGLLTATDPLGPFEYSQHSPISAKDSGFITSAGHSCLFQDRHGNWWRAVTMLIGVHDRFERRIGLFPAGFDADGVPFTRTELGDLPITMPDGKRDHGYDVDVRTGWSVISDGAAMTASSSLPDRAPAMAADEEIRTWWSAATGDAGEWLQLDLGEVRELRAAQVNLYEQDYRPAALPVPPGTDAHRFKLSASADGSTWEVVMDRSDHAVASPHAYAAFDQPLRARYLKVENVSTPGGGKFAVSDLRAFGPGIGQPPAAVAEVSAERDPQDRRKVTVSWKPADRAAAYLIRYGIEPTKLYRHYLVRGGDATSHTLHGLNNDPRYHFRVDAVNDARVTEGVETVQVQ